MDNLETLDKVKLLKERLARDGIDKKVDLTAKNSLNEIWSMSSNSLVAKIEFKLK